MNLLYVIHYPVFGGPHSEAMQLARPLQHEGVELTVVVPDTGDAAGRVRTSGAIVVTMPLHRVRATVRPSPLIALLRHLPGEVAAIRKVIREREIDVVQLAGLVNPHAAIAAWLERKAIVWQLLDTRPPMTVRRIMMLLVVRMADVVMSTGRAVAEVHPGTDGLGERLCPFFPPVNVDEFRPDVIDLTSSRSAYGFGPDDLVLVGVGNLNPQKGHEYLLRAVDLLRGDGHPAKALIVGASHETHVAYEQGLRTLCARLGLETGQDVIFTGPLNDVRPALAAADVFVLSSIPRSEGVPTAAEEAMAMGLPVVSTDVGGVSELVEDGVTGFVVPPLDAQALADAIARLVDPAVRLELGARGRERAVDLCSADQCAQTHLEAYSRALEHRSARRSGRPMFRKRRRRGVG